MTVERWYFYVPFELSRFGYFRLWNMMRLYRYAKSLPCVGEPLWLN